MLEHILLPLDGSKMAECILPHAVTLAKTFESKVTLLRVVYSDTSENQHLNVNPIAWQMRKSEATSYLEKIQKQLEDVDVESEIQILEGKPAQQIIEYSRSIDAQMVILSSHGSSGISEWNINSTAQKVLLRAFIPVMIIRAYKETALDLDNLKYERILIPLDGSKRAECILSIASSIGKAHSSEIILAHVVEEPKLPRQSPMNKEELELIDKITTINRKEMSNYIEQLNSQLLNNQAITHIESSGKPAVALHNIIDQENVDLVILSAHGLSGDNKWPYGQTALSFIVYGTTPIIIFQDLKKGEIETSLAEKSTEQMKGH